MRHHFKAGLGLMLALAACGATPDGNEAPLSRELVAGGAAAAHDAPEACWAMEQAETIPAPGDGPAVWRTETMQALASDASLTWFRTPCPEEMSTGFVSTLQQALSIRGLYQGAVTGVIDIATLKAIRSYQAPLGLDSAMLSLGAARRLGLMPWSD